jgi:hypothetical protein
MTMVAPDLEFFRRYAESGTYGFWLELPGFKAEQLFKSESPDWVTLNLNPQDVSVSEPHAANVSFLQGGGKFVEDRGGLVKRLSVRGTTGYLPSKRDTAIPVQGYTVGGQNTDTTNKLYVDAQGAEDSRARRSGFAAFHKLRFLFQKFAELRKRGETVFMNYYDAKNDFFWLIQPSGFSFSRSARKPFTFEYSIDAQVLEESTASARTQLQLKHDPYTVKPKPLLAQVFDIGTAESLKLGTAESFSIKASGISLPPKKTPGVLQTLKRMLEMGQNGLAYLRNVAGIVHRKFQGVLNQLGVVTQFLNDVADTSRYLLDTILGLFKLLNGEIDAAFDAFHRFAPDNVKRELNEFLCELKLQTAFLVAHFIDEEGSSSSTRIADADASFSTARHKLGSTDDLMKDTGTPLAVNPFIGNSTLDLATDLQALASNPAVRPEVIYDNESIYDIAQRLLGSPLRFVDLIIINNLQAPYIVASKQEKPDGTLAWGEYINVPDTDGGIVSHATDKDTSAPSFAGTVSDFGTTTEVRDHDKQEKWRPDQWAGYSVTMLSGPAVTAGDATRLIVSNDQDVLTLNRAWSVSPGVGNSYKITLEQFDLRRPRDPETQAYGRSLLLAFRRSNGSSIYSETRCDLVRSASGRLATVRGKENFSQALLLQVSTERGRHPFHPDYGLLFPIGRPFDRDLMLMYTFFAKRGLLRDRRIASVRKPKLSFEGGALFFQAEIQPVAAKAPQKFQERL